MNNHLPVDITTARHYTWGEGCDSWVLAEGENFSVKQERMPPGTTECLHLHQRAAQFFYILQGSAVFTLHESAEVIHRGQGMFVPPGTGHFIANTADEPLEFLVISQPSTEHDRVLLPGSRITGFRAPCQGRLQHRRVVILSGIYMVK